MSRILVLAPHPDDETLGCGGTLLKHISRGNEVFWLIGTELAKGLCPENDEKAHKRDDEIQRVSKAYGFTDTFRLGIQTTHVDRVPASELVQGMERVFSEVRPNVLYLPFDGDAHSDHRLLSKAALSNCKWFRSPTITEIMFYETLSETNFNLSAQARFSPTIYEDISDYLDKKIEIMSIYQGEMGIFPFPRSEDAIKSMCKLRGAESGFAAAEAFQLLRSVRA